MDPSLITLRTALILLLAVLTGIGATVLTLLAAAPLPYAVLTGTAAFAAAIPFFNNLIERN
ncbi:hypothetical protein J2Z21_002846 [Streptomyces griseochromogenes]|uniref:Uncharacterized protein n=1 Tax=Streptomyces griseochromogenes TaxID=68214 RepID=A0ABS4LR91_9ACTN|nr:hypothetical protein [Streptomyces griseochromogenes]MBP2049910.1 hypothetical protein [Streptomyces griseochromogenes]